VDPDWLCQPAPEDPGADHGLAPTGGAGWPGGDHDPDSDAGGDHDPDSDAGGDHDRGWSGDDHGAP
jgi:hypothetical protein